MDFEPGVSVIIGENNSGKSSLLSALRLVFEGDGARSLERYDFYQGIDTFDEPPRISITATLSTVDGEDTPAELGAVATWLADVGDENWQAKLTYHFYLPESQTNEFTKLVGEDPDEKAFWRALDRVLPRYVARIDAGAPGVEQPGHQRVEPRDLSVFGVDFLDAIRDVEREMFSGRKPRLRAMLQAAKEDDRDATEALEEDASDLVQSLKDRIDVDKLFQLAKDTGAVDGGKPDLDDNMREEDVIRALRLVVEDKTGKLPIAYNGLGYNNLLYISLILASLDTDTVEKVGPDNATLFPMLLIEEPEAHLHPALQFKLLKFINKRVSDGELEGNRARSESHQVFVTTHSTHVTSATDLDSVVALSEDSNGEISASYPGRVYKHVNADGGAGIDGVESKAYVERFLDATKSTMLFARRVILVEGIAEQILIPTFADACGYSLEDKHVAVVGMGGRTFKHFLPLFGGELGDDAPLALDRRVACIVDPDPAKKKPESNSYSNCYPYELETRVGEGYKYRPKSGVVENLQAHVDSVDNIRIFSGEKTLEYDLAKVNATSDILVTNHCVHEAHLRNLANDGEVNDTLESKVDRELCDLIDEIGDKEERRGARYATYYLECLSGKGEHAQTLNLKLVGNDYAVPAYIKNAIEWVCE